MSKRRSRIKRAALAAAVAGLLVFASGTPAGAVNVNGERIDWLKKMATGQNIGYWIAPGNEYTTSIPNAVQKIMYPSGMSNPMVLWKTTVNSNSNMDFYQYYSSSSTEPVAKTTSHRKNASGNYYAMPVSEKDTYNWVYAEVRLNDYHMDGLTNTKREAVIVHEMLHGYGLRDLYNNANRASIMFGSISGTATGLTSDANSILNAKY